MDCSASCKAVCQPVMPDDHSKLVPLLPIPNRTVKRLSADDSADSRVKVGHRQALIATFAQLIFSWALCFNIRRLFLSVLSMRVHTKVKQNLITARKAVYNLRLS